MRAEPLSSSTASREPPGLPGKASVEGLLEAADARPGVPIGKPCLASFGRSSSAASPISPVTSIAALPSGCSRSSAGPSASGVPSRARIAARGARSTRFSRCSPLSQAGEDQARVPGYAAIGVGHVELGADVAEGDRPGFDRYRHDRLPVSVNGILRRVDVDRAQRGDLRGFPVGLGEFICADQPPRGVVQLPVHRAEVLAGPGLRHSARLLPSRASPVLPWLRRRRRRSVATTISGSSPGG